MNWKQSLSVAIKEFIKVTLLAMIPLIITGLSKGKIDYLAVGVAGAIAFLNALSEFLKKWDTINYNGIMGQ